VLLDRVQPPLFSWFLAIALFGCEPANEATASVELRVGAKSNQARNFEAVTSLAEYVEIPGAGNELRLTIASYAASCDVFKPPPNDEVRVSVVITTPEGVSPASGVYPWLGHEAHGGEVLNPAKAFSYPSVRIGHRSYLFRPGGAVVLKGLSLNRHGSVSGLFNYEFSGDAKHPATSLKGRFSARVCRYSSSESS
jgi:hypothetical protein